MENSEDLEKQAFKASLSLFLLSVSSAMRGKIPQMTTNNELNSAMDTAMEASWSLFQAAAHERDSTVGRLRAEIAEQKKLIEILSNPDKAILASEPINFKTGR